MKKKKLARDFETPHCNKLNYTSKHLAWKCFLHAHKSIITSEYFVTMDRLGASRVSFSLSFDFKKGHYAFYLFIFLNN